MPKKGYKQTIKHREKISKGLKNSKVGNAGRFTKGNIPCNKNHRKYSYDCLNCGNHFGTSDKRVKYCSRNCGHRSMGGNTFGFTSEKVKGEKNVNWKGGITPFNTLLRKGSKWKIWRELVFLRDNFTCQNKDCEFCNNKMGGTLHPHHIKQLAFYPELAFKVDNGITYCKDFHLKSGLHVLVQKES